MKQQTLVDRYGRHHNYLRISVTDRCNFRCRYCMKPEGVEWLAHDRILSYEEIIKVVQAAAALGVSRVRLTGGEPLVRKHICRLISGIRSITGIGDLSLTTNGVLLPGLAAQLKEAGLQRVNISLDSLNADTFQRITGKNELDQVIAGIKSALEYDLKPVKINMVVMQGINSREIADFIRLAHEMPLEVRFIEYMPVGPVELYNPRNYQSLAALPEIAAALDYKLLAPENPLRNGPAEVFELVGGKGRIGVIHPVSRHFCASCNRIRLTSDGYLKPCLYWNKELAIRPVINFPEELKRMFREALRQKPKRHRMAEPETANRGARFMSRIGG